MCLGLTCLGATTGQSETIAGGLPGASWRVPHSPHRLPSLALGGSRLRSPPALQLLPRPSLSLSDVVTLTLCFLHPSRLWLQGSGSCGYSYVESQAGQKALPGSLSTALWKAAAEGSALAGKSSALEGGCPEQRYHYCDSVLQCVCDCKVCPHRAGRQ